MTGFKSKKAAAQAKLTVDRTQVEQWLEALKDIDALHHPAEPESADAQKAIANMGQVLEQPAQEPDELTIAYMSGLYDGKKKRTWVGLTIEEIASCCRESTTTQLSFYNAIEAKLKEKNT